MEDRRGVARSTSLAAIAFVATLVLLVGLVLGVRGTSPTSSDEATAPIVSAGPSDVAGAPTPTPTPAVTSQATPSASASSGGADPVLVGAGDIGDCNTDDDEATAKLLDDIPGTVFAAGDNAYPDGSKAKYKECYEPTWGRHKDRTRPVPGNHDYMTKRARGYLDYFGAAAVNADGDPWYSYDLGAWHIVALDSECEESSDCGPDSTEGRWLKADLAASNAKCTLAMWHVPRFSSGFHGNNKDLDGFWRVLYDAGADVIVNGHDHDYERFAPQDPDAKEDRVKGIREFVAGTGGTKLRVFEKFAANSQVRAAVTHGVLKFTLHATSYDWQFIPSSGDFSDAGSAACH
jgi:hypothetical protein